MIFRRIECDHCAICIYFDKKRKKSTFTPELPPSYGYCLARGLWVDGTRLACEKFKRR